MWSLRKEGGERESEGNMNYTSEHSVREERKKSGFSNGIYGPLILI